jgi:hypothetical protein
MSSDGEEVRGFLEESFLIACEKCKSSAKCSDASNEDKLRLYGLYKQVFDHVAIRGNNTFLAKALQFVHVYHYSKVSIDTAVTLWAHLQNTQPRLAICRAWSRSVYVYVTFQLRMVFVSGDIRRHRYPEATRRSGPSTLFHHDCEVGGI